MKAMPDAVSPEPKFLPGKDFVFTSELNPTPKLIGEFLTAKSQAWRLGLDPLDEQIQQSLDILSQIEDKPQAAQVIMDTIMLQLDHNQAHFDDLFYHQNKPTREAEQQMANIQIQFNALWSAAWKADPDTVITSLLTHLDTRINDEDFTSTFKQDIIQRLLSSKAVVEHPIKQTNTISIRYMAKDFVFDGLDGSKKYTFAHAPGGIILAINQATSQVENYFVPNILLPPNREGHPYIIQPGIDHLMLLGFTQHQMPNQETIHQFLTDLPALSDQIRPFLDKTSSPLQYHAATFYQLWEACGRQAQIPPEVTTYLSHFGEHGLELFTAGIFQTAEINQVMKWLVELDEPGKHTNILNFGKNLLKFIRDVSNHADNFSRRACQSHESELSLRQTLYDQTRAIILTGIELSNQSDESVQDKDAILNFVISGLSNQLDTINNLVFSPTDATTSKPMSLAETTAFILKNNPHITSDGLSIIKTNLMQWFSHSMFNQTNAPYYHHIEKITAEFYRKYATIALDTTRTTVNIDIEKPKHRVIFKADADAGRLVPRPPDDPYTVIFSGCAGMRIESHLKEPILSIVKNAKFIGLDPHPSPDHTAQSQGLDEFYTIALQTLYLHPEFKNSADEIEALGSPLMDIVIFHEQVRAIMSLSHTLKMGGLLKTDNAFSKGKNSYEAEINQAKQAMIPGHVEGIFTRTWQNPHTGEVFGKFFDGKDPIDFIQLMQEAGFEPVNFPSDAYAIKAICAIASLDDSFIVRDDMTRYVDELITANSTEIKEVMEMAVASRENIITWLTEAKQALYQVPNPDRNYNRWLLEFQKVREPSPLFRALFENVEKHFVLPSQVKQPAIN